jgi:hypothetical protein
MAQENYPPLKGEFEPKKTLNDLPLVFSDDFESGTADRWEPTDKSAWTVKDQGGNKVYALTKKKSDFNPKHRSPYNRSLVKDVEVGSFVLDVKLQSTHPDYGHRDLCLFFGYQDDAHLYYVHFGKKTDDHANQIFIVNDSDRKKISTKTTPGTDWDDDWHHARIVRNADTGKIEVFFDDMENPVMVAEDKTFTTGRVGVGSFDDTGQFDHIALYGYKRPKIGKVQGKVTLNGTPLAAAHVIFEPTDNENGALASAVTDDDGNFTLTSYDPSDGASVGTHRVVIIKGADGVPHKFSKRETTPLSAEVNSGDNTIDFELKE